MRIAGPVLKRDSEGYDTERTGYQEHKPHRPELIAGATGPEDVAAAVSFAARHDMPLTVQATGHGVGQAAEHGLLVTTGRMREVTIDPTAATARIAAGARWQDVISRAAPHGLAPLSGSAPSVGAVGYTLAGGVGLLSRAFGFASDHVRRVELVDANGEHQVVTADRDPELFWAIRGGRGNFGVVTAIEIDLLRLDTIYGGGLYFDVERHPEVLDTWLTWTRTVEGAMCSSIALLPMPDVPGVPEALRGRHVAHIRVAFGGETAQGERLVAPLRAVGGPLIDTLGELRYADSATIHNEPPGPMAYRSAHMLAERLPSEAGGKLLDTVGPGSSFPSILEIRHLGGAMARPPALPSAVPRRDGYLVGMLSKPGDEPGAFDAAREVLRPWISDGLIQNFLDGDFATPEHVRRCFSVEDYARLAALKAARDPHDLFRLGHHIPLS